MNSRFGHKLRNLRRSNKMLLRHLASQLDMDPAQLSKIERGERSIKRETVLRLATIFSIETDDLITLWLADQVCEIVKNEKNALLALMLAEESVKHNKEIK